MLKWAAQYRLPARGRITDAADVKSFPGTVRILVQVQDGEFSYSPAPPRGLLQGGF